MKEGMFTLKEILDSGLLNQVSEEGSAIRWKDYPALVYKCESRECYSPKLLERIGLNYMFIDEQGDGGTYYIQLTDGNIYCLTFVNLEL